MPKLIEDKVLTLVRRAGVLRPRDLTQHDISRQYLLRLQRRGHLQKLGRCLYVASDTHLTDPRIGGPMPLPWIGFRLDILNNSISEVPSDSSGKS